MPIRILDFSDKDEPYLTSKSHSADILLMEIAKVSPFTLEEGLKVVHKVRDTIPKCKIVFLCDENADPEVAESVKDAKKIGLIDSFFYSSVSGEYLSAMLDAL